MERPALTRLVGDIEAGKIDVVVVYKVDRLTRALSDFAKLVDVFDRHGVSFVSITQQFNTTTSMGRLTLNVLLSFAQFEREVIAERVRDKIAASKKKGMWMGGMPPLGYDVKDRKLIVNKDEARTVIHIFRRYLELKSVRALEDELSAKGILSKRRTHADGTAYGGYRLSRGALYLMLQNSNLIAARSRTRETPIPVNIRPLSNSPCGMRSRQRSPRTGWSVRPERIPATLVCTEKSIRVDLVTESPTVSEPWSRCCASG